MLYCKDTIDYNILEKSWDGSFCSAHHPHRKLFHIIERAAETLVAPVCKAKAKRLKSKFDEINSPFSDEISIIAKEILE